jgi:predicted metalloendopeptidase
MSTTPSPKSDFYRWVNHPWLTDPSVTIPAEYPRWGAFTKLADEALKNQIGLLQGVAAISEPSADEAKLAHVWRLSMARFNDWEAGKGDYAGILEELKVIAAGVQASVADDAQWRTALAKYLSRMQEVGLRYPFHFDKGSNFEDSDNIILDLSPSGLSLPSRMYYLDSKFAEQRTWFKAHLQNVHSLVGPQHLANDFVEGVIRFETKLAQITMKQDQCRLYVQYYTITSLDGVIDGLNDHKALEEKQANYPEHEVAEGEPDADILTATTCTVSDSEREAVRAFQGEI